MDAREPHSYFKVFDSPPCSVSQQTYTHPYHLDWAGPQQIFRNKEQDKPISNF